MSGTLTDRQLLRQLQRGQGRALRDAYQTYKDCMLALAIALIRDYATAEDVVHEVFVNFARLAPTLRLRGSLKGYLLTAVANRVRSLQRRRDAGEVMAEHCDVPSLAELPDPVDQVVTAELLEHVYQAIGELVCEQREVIVLRLQGDMSFKQIARAQNVSLGTVLSRYRYGLNKLRQGLDHEAE